MEEGAKIFQRAKNNVNSTKQSIGILTVITIFLLLLFIGLEATTDVFTGYSPFIGVWAVLGAEVVIYNMLVITEYLLDVFERVSEV